MRGWIAVLLGFSIGALLAAAAPAEELQSKDASVALAERIMDKILAEDIEGALELAKPHRSLSFGEFNAFARRTTEAFEMRPGGFGAPVDYTLIEQDTVGDALLRLYFLEKFERKPLGWEFFFYKGKDVWRLIGFRFFGDERALMGLPRIPLPAAGRERS